MSKDHPRIVAVVVTHRRRELLAKSLDVLASQSRPIDHLIVDFVCYSARLVIEVDGGQHGMESDAVRDAWFAR